ncbi:hypothetical protein chiPu_0028204, partial [Chiloscyllium punctatum]|nr:hypothetical protein [Chiloscyllium punctatum]
GRTGRSRDHLGQIRPAAFPVTPVFPASFRHFPPAPVGASSNLCDVHALAPPTTRHPPPPPPPNTTPYSRGDGGIGHAIFRGLQRDIPVPAQPAATHPTYAVPPSSLPWRFPLSPSRERRRWRGRGCVPLGTLGKGEKRQSRRVRTDVSTARSEFPPRGGEGVSPRKEDGTEGMAALREGGGTEGDRGRPHVPPWDRTDLGVDSDRSIPVPHPIGARSQHTTYLQAEPALGRKSRSRQEWTEELGVRMRTLQSNGTRQ